MDTSRCTLDPPALAARMQAFAEVLGGTAGATETLPGRRFRMTLDLDDDRHERLEELAAAEAECCPWLGLTVRRDPAGRTLLEGKLAPTPMVR